MKVLLYKSRVAKSIILLASFPCAPVAFLTCQHRALVSRAACMGSLVRRKLSCLTQAGSGTVVFVTH